MLSWQFRTHFPDRWLRIHSLRDSQRYPASEADWQALLSRHNEAMNAVVAAGDEVVLIRAVHYWAEDPLPNTTGILFCGIPGLGPFVELEPFDQHFADPDFRIGSMLRPDFSSAAWERGRFDSLLRLLAIGDEQVFFLSPSTMIIVAPYDGGIDFIFPNEQMRDEYRIRFQDWLSTYPGGT